MYSVSNKTQALHSHVTFVINGFAQKLLNISGEIIDQRTLAYAQVVKKYDNALVVRNGHINHSLQIANGIMPTETMARGSVKFAVNARHGVNGIVKVAGQENPRWNSPNGQRHMVQSKSRQQDVIHVEKSTKQNRSACVKQIRLWQFHERSNLR